MTCRLAVLLATLSIAGLPAGAAADSPAVASSTTAVASPAVRVDLGVASPVGVFGVVYTRPLSTWRSRLGIEAGAGLGLSGLQLSGIGSDIRPGDPTPQLRVGFGRTF